MIKITLRAVALICAALSLAAPAAATEFKSADWTHTFYDNCGLPVPTATADRPASAQWVSVSGDSKMYFYLEPGDMGGCGSDDSRRDGAAYWERVEMKQADTLPRGRLYDISLQATFLQGFTGENEAFMQLQSWESECRAAPLLMMQFDRGELAVKILKPRPALFGINTRKTTRGDVKTVIYNGSTPKIGPLIGQPQNFRVMLDLRDEPYRMSVFMNGRALVENDIVFLQDCSEPYLKFGIYRPGGRLNNPDTSRLLVDDVRILSQR